MQEDKQSTTWWDNSLERNTDDRREAHRKFSPSASNTSLCATCQKVDFGYLLFGDVETAYRQNAHETIYLGTLENIWRQALAGCAFCADIVLPEARKAVCDLPTPTPAPSDDCVFVGLEVRDGFISSFLATSHRSNAFTVCIEVQGERERPQWTSAAGIPLQPRPTNYLGIRSSDTPICLLDHDMSAYRRLKPRLDLGQCKEWFEMCCGRHEECRQKKMGEGSASSPNPFFKLIDVTKREVVILGNEGSHRYATLSYVCGAAYTLCVLQGSVGWKEDKEGTWRHLLPTELPNTIEDALRVTARIGLQYLWVDSTCIAQDNRDEKQAQILAMYDIYANAEICIVAASGADSTHGLPGVRESRKLAGGVAGVFLQSGQSTVIGTRPPALHEALKGYRWIRRAWTYQEVILARRCLIFTETEAFFFCTQETLRESLTESGTHAERDYWMSDVWGDIDFMTMTSANQPSERDDNFGRTSLQNYDAAMREYTRRELTYQEDGLNAFRGMERLFGQYIGCETIAGCPWPLLTNCLEWQLQDILCAEEEWPSRRMSRDLKDEENDNDLHLIPLLPSWAWAGWKGSLRRRRGKRYPPGTEMKVLQPGRFSPIPVPISRATSPYTFAITNCTGEKNERFLRDTLPGLAKISRGHFQVTAMDDVPGFAYISTADGQIVGECDVRGTLDTATLSTAQDAVVLQLYISPDEGTLNFTCNVLLLQLQDLLDNQPELAKKLVTEAASAQVVQTLPQRLPEKDARAKKGVMLHECPSELMVPDSVPPSIMAPLLATRLGLGCVRGDAWRESRPDDNLVFLV